MKRKKCHGVLKSVCLIFLVYFLFLNIIIAKSEEADSLAQAEKIEAEPGEVKEIEAEEKAEIKEERKEYEEATENDKNDKADDITKKQDVKDVKEEVLETEIAPKLEEEVEKTEAPAQLDEVNLEKKTGIENLVQKDLVENVAENETGNVTKVATDSITPNEETGEVTTENTSKAEPEQEEPKLAGIVFSEIVIGDENSAKNEFIELYNFSDKEIDLKGFSLKKKTKGGSRSNLVSTSGFLGSIGKGEFFVIKNQNFKGMLDADLVFSGSSYSVAKDNRIYLEDSEGNLIDAIGWGNCEKDCEEGMIFSELKDGQSLSRKNLENPKSFLASEFEITNIKTPGAENIFSKSLKYAEDIVFSEVLSNPDGADKNFEWIEFENKGAEKANLDGWAIENGSGKRFKLVDFGLGAGELGIVFIRNSSFVIRNTNEKLLLINPAEKVVSSIFIPGSAPSGVSFGWSEERGWSWQKKQTPNGKNIANQLPKISIKRDKKVYRNTYAFFDASKSKDGDKDKLKFVWDFGDGRKSYLRETKHMYKKKGVYNASLLVKDGFEVVRKDFKVEVKSYPRRELRFTQLLPNPVGKDKGNEMIEIENLSSKKVNLFNFYIAKGHKASSVTRHRILEDFILKPGEKRFITNEKICLFSLLNAGGRVQLLYPDGKRAFEVEYEKEKINEGDIFRFDGENWEWLSAKVPLKEAAKTEKEVPTVESDEDLLRKINAILSRMTLNEELKICETYLKMQIENWKNSERSPKVSLLKRISVNLKFSAQESF